MKLEGNTLLHLDGTAQAELVRNGDLSAEDLLNNTVARIERVNPKVNALASLDIARARQKASVVDKKAVFSGVPTLIKDVLSYPDHPLGFGSRLFDGMSAPGGSEYTEALDTSGLVVLGKSTTSEFGLLGTTETLAKGATRNPWNLSRSPGGSSGGAVAAVASGMVPVAHASDGGGSIRGPSSFCGLFGFKPSRDRVVDNGMPPDMPLSGLVVDHCVSRTVRDSYNWLRATERPETGGGLKKPDPSERSDLPRLKIGVFQAPLDHGSASPEVLAALRQTVGLCVDLGHDVLEIPTPAIDIDATAAAYFTLTGATLAGFQEQARAMMGDAFQEEMLEPYTRAVIARGQQLSADDVVQSLDIIQQAAAVAEEAMSGLDVLLSPTVPFQAFSLGKIRVTDSAATLDAFIRDIAGYTVIASLAGWPAMSVPFQCPENGLPVGSHFSAGHGQDNLLFSLAFELERAAPWQPRLIRMMETL